MPSSKLPFLCFALEISEITRVVVSVSTSRSRDVPTSRLGLVSRKIVNVSVPSRSREADVSVLSRSRPFTFHAQDSFLVGMQMAPYAV